LARDQTESDTQVRSGLIVTGAQAAGAKAGAEAGGTFGYRRRTFGYRRGTFC
jgi:hypothetical protein